ncbi:MAG TPA: glycosyltransferase [Thermoanaerobaculia bacterium]|nr:glycosyltransferase [Thermoanaerobaculia bacterium]
MRRPAKISAVVPTLGASPLLAGCLEALRGQASAEIEMEIVVVDQGACPLALSAGVADRVLRLERNLGFAGGTNVGLRLSTGELVATVNDDLLVEPGWARELAAALAAHPGAAAAQGVNLLLERPALADGCGLAWNRSWQAVQVGHGLPAPPADGPAREVFGVSATAALFRRAALDAVALPGGGAFDERLGSYYEDVDLACRLRAAGFTALSVPAARARHAGSATGRAGLGVGRQRMIYGNRYLVAARLLGSGFWPRLPRLVVRDWKDLAIALAHGEAGAAAGIAAGWGHALVRLPGFAWRGGPAVPLTEIARFR